MGSSVPNVPMDPNLGAAQSSAMSGAAGLNSNIGNYQNLYNAQANSPYASQALAGSQAAGQMMQGQGYQNINTANMFAGVPSQLSPAISATLSTAYDPQNALYQSEYQKSMDQTNAQLAQSGLSFTPWAAGVTGDAADSFNTSWLQSQLGREQTGASTIAQLLGAGEGAATTGATLGNQGATQIATGAALPYQTQTGINTNTATALGNLTAAQQQQLQDYINYYSAATGNTQAAVQAGQANNQYASNIGLGAGLLANSALGSSMGSGLMSSAGAGIGALGSGLGNLIWDAGAFLI